MVVAVLRRNRTALLGGLELLDLVEQFLNLLLLGLHAGFQRALPSHQLSVLLVVLFRVDGFLLGLRKLILKHVDHVVLVLDDFLLSFGLVQSLNILA